MLLGSNPSFTKCRSVNPVKSTTTHSNITIPNHRKKMKDSFDICGYQNTFFSITIGFYKSIPQIWSMKDPTESQKRMHIFVDSEKFQSAKHM